jgi:hypothetical protein
MSVRRTVATLALVAVAVLDGGATGCGETAAPHGTPGPRATGGRRAEPLQVFVTGTGAHVWILLVVDGSTRDVHTDYVLPYRRDVDSHFGVKVEARNGTTDRGSITCEFKDHNGVVVGQPQTAHGAGAFVRCIHDTTRA